MSLPDGLGLSAFETASAHEANTAIASVRTEVAARFGAAKSIEIVVNPDEDAAALRRRLLRTLTPVIEGFGASLDAGEGPVFLSLFVQERLLFFTPKALMDALRAASPPVALLQ